MAIAFAVVAICFFAVSASAAPSLEPGVHVDPGSPAAKEYALPLNQARQTGSAPKAGSSVAVLFGVGIHPRGGSGSGSLDSESHQAGLPNGTTPVSVSRTSGLSTISIVPAAVIRASGEHGSSGGDGSILALVGGGVAILVLGGFGGAVMRRSQPTGHVG